MSATGVKKSYKGYIANSKGTAHFFNTGENTCLCGAMKVDTLEQRSRVIPPGVVKISKKCATKRQKLGV